MLIAVAALTLALQDIPASPALWPLSPPPVLDVWAPIRGPVGVWEETPNKLRPEARMNEVLGVGLLGNTAYDTTIGISTRLDPPPPDAWISTQNELKDGATWVLSWAAEVAEDCALPESLMLPEMPLNVDRSGPPASPSGRATGSPLDPSDPKPFRDVAAFEPTPHFAHLVNERRLHPVAPDSHLATEVELADGSTWVLAWSAELAGQEAVLGNALKTLSRFDNRRLVVRVQASDPLLECERVRFALGKDEGLAEWILALPREAAEQAPHGPSAEGLFRPGFLCALVWQQEDPRPHVTANTLDRKLSEEVRAYNRAVERFNQGGPEAPRPEDIARLRLEAFRSMVFDVRLYSDVDWREKSSTLKAWGKRLSSESEQATGDEWLPYFLEYRLEGFEAGLEALENIGAEREKALRRAKAAKPESKAYSKWIAEFDRLSAIHRNLWFNLASQARQDLTRAYHLACAGRTAPLKARWTETERLFEWTLDQGDFYQLLPDALRALSSEMNAVPMVLQHPAAQSSLEQEAAFSDLRDVVRFNSKRLAAQGERLALIEALCPNSPTADRCRAWQTLLAGLK